MAAGIWFRAIAGLWYAEGDGIGPEIDVARMAVLTVTSVYQARGHWEAAWGVRKSISGRTSCQVNMRLLSRTITH